MMVAKWDAIEEPGRDQLFAGEAVAVKSRRILSRRGRIGVRVRAARGFLGMG